MKELNTPVWYNLLWWLLTPVYKLRVWLRSRHEIDYYEEVAQRFGDASYYVRQLKCSTAPVWVHAVSVGESHVAEPIIRYLLGQGVPVLVSNTTRTGAKRISKIFADTPRHLLQQIWMPVDRKKNVSALLQALMPQQLILIETELWPNLLCACAKQEIPVLLLNARLSSKSAHNYAKLPQLTRQMLACLSHVAAQDEASLLQFVRLGLPPERVSVEGSIKFDLAPPKAMLVLADDLRRDWQLRGRKIWVAASTHAGEDAPLLQVHQAMLDEYADALLILVPRHPERFAEVTKLAYASGLNVTVRSKNQTVTAATQVLVADSMGEMWAWFALAELAFVGGTLVEVGGHNPLEPLYFEIPVLMGPHYHNFSSIVERLQGQGALKVVQNTAHLSEKMQKLWHSPAKYAQVSQAAKLVMEENKGSLDRQCAIVERHLKDIRAPQLSH